MVSGTVRAGLGFKAATVPFVTVPFANFLRKGAVVDVVLFRDSSDSIFFLMAWIYICSNQDVFTTRGKGDRNHKKLYLVALALLGATVGKLRARRGR